MIQGLRHIRAFLSVARLGSFTRAAAELHVSQPALTVQIRQLEEALGVRLFDRNKRQVFLTQAGKGLLVPLERVLLDLESVLNASHDLALLRRGVVSVAVLPSVAACLLPAAIRRFRETYPGIVVNVSDVVAGQIVQMVKAEDVDFGIGSRLTPDRGIAVEDFLSDRMCAFCLPGHPLTEGPDPNLREVARHPLILTAPGSSVRKLVERALDREGAEISVAGEANYMSTAVGMVRAGLGVAILPESAVEAVSCSGLVVRPIRSAGLVRKIGIIRKAGRSLSPAAANLVEAIRQVATTPLSHFSATE